MGRVPALHVIACLSQVEDLDIHLVSKRPWALTRFSRMVRSYQILKEGQNLPEVLAEANTKHKADLVMPVDMIAIHALAEQRDTMDLPVRLCISDSAQGLHRVWNKGLLADFLFANQISHPETITSRGQYEREIRDFVFPILIKPRLAGGGTGIEKFTECEALMQRVEESPGFFENYIVQAYIEGEDIDCSVLCKDGRILAYTIQKGLYTARPDSFQAPDAIEFLHQPTVLETTMNLMSVLGWNGVAHIDLRKRAEDGKIAIIEINPRYWGSLEGSLHAGVNFPYLAARISMGESFPLPAYSDLRYSSALSAVKRRLKNKPSPSLWGETNLRYYLQDPLPALARLVGMR